MGNGPAFVVEATNETDVPAHTFASSAAIEILTGNNGFTFMEMVFEMAGFPVAH
jgi:hypothetical protein